MCQSVMGTKLGCYLCGHSQCEDLHDQNVALSTISSVLRILLQPNLV